MRTTGPLLFTLILTFCTTALAQERPAVDERENRQMRADCRLEGETGGLKGADLDEFVETCVEDLLGIELKNLQHN